MLPSEDLKRRNTAAKDWYLFISYASAIIQGPPIFHCDPKFFQLYHSLMDSSMLFFTKFLPKIPGGFSHPNQWAAHRLCKNRLYPFRAGKSARKRPLARVRPKSLPKGARNHSARQKETKLCSGSLFIGWSPYHPCTSWALPGYWPTRRHWGCFLKKRLTFLVALPLYYWEYAQNNCPSPL